MEKGMQNSIIKVYSSAHHFCFVSRFNAAWFPSPAACNCNNSKQAWLIHLRSFSMLFCKLIMIEKEKDLLAYLKEWKARILYET